MTHRFLPLLHPKKVNIYKNAKKNHKGTPSYKKEPPSWLKCDNPNSDVFWYFVSEFARFLPTTSGNLIRS